jgi:hypothetical protein
MINNIFMTRNRNYPQSRPSSGWTTCQLTINPDNNSGTSPRTRTKMMVNQILPWLGLFMHTFVLCLQFCCLLKPITHIYIPKTAEDELSAHSASSHSMSWACNKPPFSAFTMPLYLEFRGRWPDLAHRISGVWALCPKLQFQDYYRWCS